ncbi:hypothetical protein AVEN_106602-1 [Araneus ventricosus]|uniref:Uncharacterized protein n=1 Tax=Araneus ventricosus TaxID=182803 RepID=A0A4Y2IX22_ARAVE|nr:hypothetical protein AVEN_106602-1 [Araneus ventricosus]
MRTSSDSKFDQATRRWNKASEETVLMSPSVDSISFISKHLPTFLRNARTTHKPSSNNDSLCTHDERKGILQTRNAERLTVGKGLKEKER